jgi:hypothetical protein
MGNQGIPDGRGSKEDLIMRVGQLAPLVCSADIGDIVEHPCLHPNLKEPCEGGGSQLDCGHDVDQANAQRQTTRTTHQQKWHTGEP